MLLKVASNKKIQKKRKATKKTSAENGHPKVRAKKRKLATETAAEDESFCIECEETIFDNISEESWLQCFLCKMWAHEKCAKKKKNYIYSDCNND